MMQEIAKMRRALGDIESLAGEVKGGLHIPKRFRKAPFTPQLRDSYVYYLEKEAFGLRQRIANAEKQLAKLN